MLFILGTNDPSVPYNGRLVIGSEFVTPIVGIDILIDFWRTNSNCKTNDLPLDITDFGKTDSSTSTVFNYINCSCNANVLFYRINGGGHSCAGLEIPLYEIIARQTNEDILASDDLCNFLINIVYAIPALK